MDSRVILVGLGCAFALNTVKHETERLPADQQRHAKAVQSAGARSPGSGGAPTPEIPPGDSGSRPRRGPLTPEGMRRNSINPYSSVPNPNGVSAPERWFQVLQDLVRSPRVTVGTWSEPWKSAGVLALDVVQFALNLAGLAAMVAGFAFVIFVAVALGRSMLPPLQRLFGSVAIDPAPARTVLAAGVGSGFSLLLTLAALELLSRGWTSVGLSLGTITVVAVGVVIFIEPLKDWVRERTGLEGGHELWRREHTWRLRIAAVGILALTSLAHGLLHERVTEQRTESTILLASAFLLPSAITYAWVVGARSSRWSAWLLGAITGFLLGAGSVLLVFWITANELGLPLETQIEYAAINAVKWGAAGGFGGLAIQRGWPSDPIRGGAMAIFATLIVSGALSVSELSLIAQDFARALGWAAGLLSVEHFARRCLPSKAEMRAVSTV
jgi:hypothetical protein